MMRINNTDTMRFKILAVATALALGSGVGMAQDTYTRNDTIYNPKIVFTGSPSRYEIAGIKVAVGSRVTDITMKNRIDSLKEELLKGGQA